MRRRMGMTGWDPSTRGRTFPRTPNRRAEMAPPHSCLGLLLCRWACRPAPVSTPQDSCMHPSGGCSWPQKGRRASHHTGTPRKEAAPTPGCMLAQGGQATHRALPSLGYGDQHSVRLRTAAHTPSPSLSIHRGPRSSLPSEPLWLDFLC